MKRNLLLLGLFLSLFYSCKKENKIEQLGISDNSQKKSEGITDPNDVNLNVNWKWYDPNMRSATIYYGIREVDKPAPSAIVTLPWYVSGNPGSDPNKDYLPELGWTLYLKDFGTPYRPAETPFFALYNKYSGVLRFFIYNFRVKNQAEQSKTYYVGELGFKNSSNYNEMLSFFAPPEKSTLGTIDPNLKQMIITKKGTSDTWINLDFTLNIRPHNYFNANEAESLKKILLLNVYGANQTDINLGTDFSTLSAKSSVGASGGNVSGLATFLNKGYEYVSSGTSFLESIEKLEQKKNGTTSSSQSNSQNSTAPQAVTSIGTVAAGVGVVKGFLGFVKSFFGGTKSASNTQTTLQYSGIVSTTGTATLTNNLYSVEFNPNFNSALSPAHYIPMYKKPIGIFYLPIIQSFAEENYYPNCGSNWNYMSTVKFSLLREHYDDLYRTFNISDASSPLKLDSVNVQMFDNTDFEQNSSMAFYRLEGNLAKYNEGITWISGKLNWKTLIPGNADITTLGYLYYDKYKRPNLQEEDPNLRPSYIGLEIKYTILDPNYPNNDSKERVIYKIFRGSSSLQTNLNTQGCPIRPPGF